MLFRSSIEERVATIVRFMQYPRIERKGREFATDDQTPLGVQVRCHALSLARDDRALTARTTIPEQREAVVACAVTIGPEGTECIAADYFAPRERRLFTGEFRVRIEPPREPRLAATVGAWAEPAKLFGGVACLVAVGPVDLETLLLAQDPERCRGVARIVRRACRYRGHAESLGALIGSHAMLDTELCTCKVGIEASLS